MHRFALPFIAAIVTGAQAVAAEKMPPAAEDARSDVPAGTLVQICVGGMEDGKFIVRHGATVIDHGVETTLKACRIDGGAPIRAPRPPAVVAGEPLVA